MIFAWERKVTTREITNYWILITALGFVQNQCIQAGKSDVFL
jgi:hypothetical protein